MNETGSREKIAALDGVTFFGPVRRLGTVLMSLKLRV
jgi:hypothetical protein